ncbi:unnamed protein product [Bemisia tabaci]|uniref:DJ-1/PfpI domain-containing protein n=1 Tax=Bemisia tabaci TaxID=7038 RepID=A0A9P0AGB1_BEMTA|nr:PREDICTED: protein deglycase DJ-1 isoform X1 [Bemisia tabaci]CAH0390576.1 unnamed protein product [Bemisia tabaci]
MLSPLVSSVARRFYCSSRMVGKNAFIVLAEGAEEMEFVVSADILRRAGIKVCVAGLKGTDPVKCSRDVYIKPDLSFDEALKNGPYDVVVLPGGPAYKVLAQSSEVGALLKEQEKANRLIAAICAAPVVLKSHGIGAGKEVTSYPSVKGEFEGTSYKYNESSNVVVDGNIVTSRGPGTAYEFALEIVKILLDEAASQKVADALLWKK